LSPTGSRGRKKRCYFTGALLQTSDTDRAIADKAGLRERNSEKPAQKKLGKEPRTATPVSLRRKLTRKTFDASAIRRRKKSAPRSGQVEGRVRLPRWWRRVVDSWPGRTGWQRKGRNRHAVGGHAAGKKKNTTRKMPCQADQQEKGGGPATTRRRTATTRAERSSHLWSRGRSIAARPARRKKAAGYAVGRRCAR